MDFYDFLDEPPEPESTQTNGPDYCQGQGSSKKNNCILQ
jgi:hypothetical protein